MLTEIASVWPEGRRADAGIHGLVFLVGEVVTPAMRVSIGGGFQALFAVFSIYASHEFNLLGWECAVTGEMHLGDDKRHRSRSCVMAGAPVAGELGDVVVTGLHGYAVPYIRYSLGDTATRGDEQCRCGAPFSTSQEPARPDHGLLPAARRPQDAPLGS